MKNSKSHGYPLIRLLKYARSYRRHIVLATIFSVLNKIFDLAPPFLIGMAVDVVVSQEDSIIAQFGITDVVTQLWALAGLTIVVWGVESGSEYALAVYWRNLAQTIQHELRAGCRDT